MASRIAKEQSHDEGVAGRSVTEIHGSVTGIQSKSITGGYGKMSGHGSVTGACLHCLLERVVCSWTWEHNYKVKLNDQPVHEWVMASFHYCYMQCCILILCCP